MLSQAAKSSGLLMRKLLMQHTRTLSRVSQSTAYSHLLKKNEEGLAIQQKPPLLCEKVITAGETLEPQRYYSSSQNGYNNSYTTHGFILLGVLLGSATIGVLTAFCDREQRKDEDDLEGPGKAEGKFLEKNYKQLDFETAKDRVDAIRKSRKLLKRKMEMSGAPGLVVCVAVDGKVVWDDGFGFADIEKNVRCTPKTVMRIASISKSITMTSLARLWEEGKVDLDEPIQKYVPYFPVKKFDGEEVTITTRQLVSHMSGIRHYDLKKQKNKSNQHGSGADTQDKEPSVNIIEEDAKEGCSTDASERDDASNSKGDACNNSKDDASDKSIGISIQEDEIKKVGEGNSEGGPVESTPEDLAKDSQDKAAPLTPKKKKLAIKALLMSPPRKKKEKEESEFDLKEYYIKEKFESIEDAVKLFQDDELFFKPGTDFLYTTHGWTLVSAVIEKVIEKPFTIVMQKLFRDLGLKNTYLDDPDRIIYNRACSYIRDKRGRLRNAPYVDNSYKWAGGGFLSTVEDLAKFGNAMLYASQRDFAVENDGDASLLPGYLKSSTMKSLWTPVHGTNMSMDKDKENLYGMGWIAREDKQTYGYCHESRRSASHTGGAIGASSILMILPQLGKPEDFKDIPPKGIVVAVIANMQDVGFNVEALKIAKMFESANKGSEDGEK